jgi:hypothetical protein
MAVKDFFNHTATQAVLIITTILACIALIIYATYRVLKTSLKAVSVTKTDTTPGDGPGQVVKSADLPVLLNGMEYGYSLWLYIDKFEERTSPRQVLLQDNVRVMLGKSANTLSYEFKAGSGSWFGAEIEYVPMARWVHITMVYREGSITFFMDGEVHSVHRLKGNGVVSTPTGDLTVGGGGGSGTSSWKGDIGTVKVLNYYPSASDVKKFYWQGPVGAGPLKWIGVNNYGVRAPLYRLNK